MTDTPSPMSNIESPELRTPEAEVAPRHPYFPYLTGQPALVTGANSGIGKAVALGLAKAGADVIVNYVVDPEGADAVVQEIVAMGRRALAIKADVSNEAEVVAMFAQAVAAFGTLHIVVSNAGLQRDAAFDQMTMEQWNKVIGVNLTGQFLCAREATREFKRRGLDLKVSMAAGKIICMSSVHQQIPWGGHVNYAASKGGVMLMMKSIAQELAPQRIRVNAVAPGWMEGEWMERMLGDKYDDLMGKRAKLTPLKRCVTADDVAETMLNLLTANRFVTGEIVVIDGGFTSST